ncbi:MAG: hypothetical protein AB7I42_03380 [Bradyrhizobium sp.]|uniref:hypothetical protein n=1 Tax=Bradyrhizobium sp. TaxID=376 RepID=UPI00353EB517
MQLRALPILLILAPAMLPATSPAAEITPKTPDSAFAGKLHPDILGVSADSTAETARSAFETTFKGRTDSKTEIGQAKFADTSTSYIATLNFSVPLTAKQNGEALVAGFSSPASENRVFFISRTLNFAQGEQPAKAEMIKQVMDKYGTPTIVGNQHLYYVYRGNSIVSVGGKFSKPALALDAIDKPLDPRMALKLNSDRGRGRGSCVAVVKRSIAAKEKSLASLIDDAKGANCDGVFSVQFTPSTQANRISIAQFVLLDVKRVISASAIDAEALAASSGSPPPKGHAPKL